MKPIENKCMLITYANSMGKDLKEMEEILDAYFSRELAGVHILPFYPSSGDRGFAVINYDTVDTAFGTWDDIKRLSEKYFLAADFMLNHISVRSAEFQDYHKHGDESPYTEGGLKVFKGIPYAAPPVGELRFRHPVNARRWRGIRMATQYSAAAIQHVQENLTMPANVHGVPQLLARSQYEEDCLYLNVWSPAKDPDAKLPVFIWIHGGGMVAGSGVECVCDGDGFAGRKDIVVVTINYRLGFFGFFAHPDLTKEENGTSGNYALYDMRKACEWVKENIANFGGDPNRITVAGQSGGAAAAA